MNPLKPWETFPGAFKLAMIWLCGLALSIQLQAQNSVRPGEQRFNRFQFRTTHNSYERDGGATARVSLTDQLDRYDVWMVELDLRWHAANNDFYIFHDCAEAGGNDTLDFFLNQIKASHRFQSGITFIYFDSGDIGPCFIYPNIVPKPSNWMTLLGDKLKAYFGNSVYYQDRFDSSDLRRWPSPQELLRRGKHIIPIVNGSVAVEFGVRDTLFGLSDITSINTSDQDAVIPDLGDSKFSRWYPTGWICGFNPDWETAVTKNFGFPASNCSSDMVSPRFHPPLPTYVGNPTSDGNGRGSWLDPFRGPNGFKSACDMVIAHQNLKGPSMVNIQVNAGAHSAPSRISAATRLTSAGGTARLAR